MKRIAFIGAAAAWAAANCSDEILPGLVDAVSGFGYARIAERDIPKALAQIERSEAKTLPSATAIALNLVEAGTLREIGALRSIEGIYTGTPVARKAVSNRVQQWELYRAALRTQVLGYAKVKASELEVEAPVLSGVSAVEKKYRAVIPVLASSVKGQLFQLSGHEPYSKYMKEHPESLKTLGFTAQQAGTILNYVNGRRSIAEIRNAASGELNEDLPLESVAAYLELLKAVQWVVF